MDLDHLVDVPAELNVVRRHRDHVVPSGTGCGENLADHLVGTAQVIARRSRSRIRAGAAGHEQEIAYLDGGRDARLPVPLEVGAPRGGLDGVRLAHGYSWSTHPSRSSSRMSTAPS